MCHDPHQPVRIRERQRLQQHAVHDAEDERVGPEADGQGQDGDDREERRVREAPHGVAEGAGGHWSGSVEADVRPVYTEPDGELFGRTA